MRRCWDELSGHAQILSSPRVAVLGFLHLYGTASPEEDFNSYAAALLSGDRDLWAAAANHLAVLRKVKLTIGFYERVDPGFDSSLFRKLAHLDLPRVGDPLP